MLKLKSTLQIFICLSLVVLLAAGCNNNRQNDLQRPTANDEQTSQSPETTDEGEVAGTEIIYLPTKNIKVGNIDLVVEVADNDDSRARGLSGRDKLDEGTGMLFDFTNTQQKSPGFWMKDMLISIDIIWINNGKIIGIESNAPLPPEDADLPVYYPSAEITHVLEVPAGWSAKNNVVIGSEVSL